MRKTPEILGVKGLPVFVEDWCEETYDGRITATFTSKSRDGDGPLRTLNRGSVSAGRGRTWDWTNDFSGWSATIWGVGERFGKGPKELLPGEPAVVFGAGRATLETEEGKTLRKCVFVQIEGEWAIEQLERRWGTKLLERILASDFGVLRCKSGLALFPKRVVCSIYGNDGIRSEERTTDIVILDYNEHASTSYVLEFPAGAAVQDSVSSTVLVVGRDDGELARVLDGQSDALRAAPPANKESVVPWRWLLTALGLLTIGVVSVRALARRSAAATLLAAVCTLGGVSAQGPWLVSQGRITIENCGVLATSLCLRVFEVQHSIDDVADRLGCGAGRTDPVPMDRIGFLLLEEGLEVEAMKRMTLESVASVCASNNGIAVVHTLDKSNIGHYWVVRASGDGLAVANPGRAVSYCSPVGENSRGWMAVEESMSGFVLFVGGARKEVVWKLSDERFAMTPRVLTEGVGKHKISVDWPDVARVAYMKSSCGCITDVSFNREAKELVVSIVGGGQKGSRTEQSVDLDLVIGGRTVRRVLLVRGSSQGRRSRLRCLVSPTVIVPSKMGDAWVGELVVMLDTDSTIVDLEAPKGMEVRPVGSKVHRFEGRESVSLTYALKWVESSGGTLKITVNEYDSSRKVLEIECKPTP